MDKFRRKATERIAELDDNKKQIAFAFSICHRLLPNYRYFSHNFEFGDEIILTTSMRYIERYLLNDEVDFDKNELLDSIKKNVPHSDDFATKFCGYAQDAASAIYHTLSNLYKVDSTNLSWTASVARDTVDSFVLETFEETCTDETSDDSDNHWMMKRELRKQESDFLLLKKTASVSREVLNSLLAFNDGKSNIDIT